MLFFINLLQPAFLAFVYFLFLSTSIANALPLRARQNGTATTVQTVHTTQTIAGPLTETCVITLTPITDKDGQPAVEEVKKCTLSYASPGPGDSTGTTTPGATATTSSVIVTATVDTTSTVPSSTTSIVGATTATTSSTTASTSTVLASTSTPSPLTTSITSTSNPAPTSTSSSKALSESGIRVNGVSTVPGTPTGTGTTAAGTTSSVTTTSPPLATTTTGGGGTASSDATVSSASVSGSAAAAEQASQSPAAAFELPGKKLSVLPIGLGVFAGISVIALIVVGLVTYERTKYRKAFRQRKLAESGTAMGYGGMAQRP